MKVEITQAHIDEANRRRQEKSCPVKDRHPIVVALQEEGYEDLSVGLNNARIDRSMVSTLYLRIETKEFLLEMGQRDEPTEPFIAELT